MQSLILMPFIAEAAALHPEAVREVDRQYAAGNFHDHAIPEGEKTFYRNFLNGMIQSMSMTAVERCLLFWKSAKGWIKKVRCSAG